MPAPRVIPPCPLGEPVELREYAASDGETYLVEIRMLRGSKKYFPHYEHPRGADSLDRVWSRAFPSQKTVRRAFNLARRQIECFLEDLPGWDVEKEDAP